MNLSLDFSNNAFLQNLLISLVALLFAAIIEFFLLPQVLLMSKKKHLFMSNGKNVLKNSTPRMAGILFLPIIMLTFLPLLAIQPQWLNDLSLSYPPVSISNLTFIMTGGVALLLIGIKDDLVGVKWSTKIWVQVVAAFFLVLSGSYINNFHGLLGIFEIPAYVGMPITVVFVVFTINAFNHVDGVDGLAGTLGIIAALALGIFSLWEQNSPYTILAFAVVGVLVPFLFYNFSRRRKVFMGSTGSLTLGYLLAFIAINYGMKGTQMPDSVVPLPTVMVWSALFIPLFDMLRVACLRIYRHKSILTSDRTHIYHKLLDLGYTHKETTIMLGICAIVIIMFNIIMRENNVNINIILILNFAMSFIFNIDLNHQKKAEKQGAEPEKTNNEEDHRLNLVKLED